jgi:hypothetical protein
MSVIRGTGWATIALWASIITVGSAAAEVPVDDFTQAAATGMYLIVDDTSGPMPVATATDSGLDGVIGGVRQLTVSTSGAIPMGQNVSAKVDTSVSPGLTPGVCANSSFSGRGTFDLLYDKGGVGLDVDLSQFKGIRILPSAVDVGVGGAPVSYKLTLVDESNNSASANVSNVQSCFEDCNEHRFLFADFTGISLRHIRSIMISVASDNAFDAIIGPITLFGSTETAPLLSPRMVAVLVAMLAVVGLIGMRRMRRVRATVARWP